MLFRFAAVAGPNEHAELLTIDLPTVLRLAGARNLDVQLAPCLAPGLAIGQGKHGTDLGLIRQSPGIERLVTQLDQLPEDK